MDIQIKAGEHINIRTPTQQDINVEHTLDTFSVTLGPRVLYSEIHEHEAWNETFPGDAVKAKEGIARQLQRDEEVKIAKLLEHSLTNMMWWKSRNGWPNTYVDAEGNRVFKAPLEHDTKARVTLTISHAGKRTLLIEDI